MKKPVMTLAFLLLSSASFANSTVECVKLIKSDADLEINSSREALNICQQYPMSVVQCAKGMDNDGTENNFNEALKDCNRSREEVKCVKTILRDADLEISKSSEARDLCRENTMREVKCAKRFDNKGIIDNFRTGLKVCQVHRKTKCVETILTDADLEVSKAMEALQICKDYTYGEISCAKEMDNEGLENNFRTGLNVCQGALAEIGDPNNWDADINPDSRRNRVPRDILGFNFRDRALMIADVAIDVSKQLEPYVNNAQEQQLDNIKKQAIRLRARINGGRDVKTVRNTLFHLGTLISDANVFIEESMETDRLDSLAEDYLTAKESIQTMINFIDRDFKGERVELY